MVNMFNSPQFVFNTKEIEVLIYTAMGLTIEETAEKTFKCSRNIRYIRASIRKKLKAKNFNHAIAIALSEKIIEPNKHYFDSLLSRKFT